MQSKSKIDKLTKLNISCEIYKGIISIMLVIICSLFFYTYQLKKTLYTIPHIEEPTNVVNTIKDNISYGMIELEQEENVYFFYKEDIKNIKNILNSCLDNLTYYHAQAIYFNNQLNKFR